MGESIFSKLLAALQNTEIQNLHRETMFIYFNKKEDMEIDWPNSFLFIKFITL